MADRQRGDGRPKGSLNKATADERAAAQLAQTRIMTVGAIATHKDFLRGIEDYLAGRDFPVAANTSWPYERGRLYAPQQRVGREHNWALVWDVVRLFKQR